MDSRQQGKCPPPFTVQTQPCDSARSSVGTLLPHPPPSSVAVTWVTALVPHPRDRLRGRGFHLSYPTHASTTRGDICTIDTVWRDQRDLGILPSCCGRAWDNLGVTGRWEELKGLSTRSSQNTTGRGLFPFPWGPCSWALGDQKSAWGGGHQFHNHPQSSGVYDASLWASVLSSNGSVMFLEVSI